MGKRISIGFCPKGDAFYEPNLPKLKSCNYKKYNEIKKIQKELSKLNIIVIRTTCAGKLANSKPCKRCIETMKAFGFKNVIYSTGDETNPIIMEKVSKINNEHLCAMDKHWTL